MLIFFDDLVVVIIISLSLFYPLQCSFIRCQSTVWLLNIAILMLFITLLPPFVAGGQIVLKVTRNCLVDLWILFSL